MRDSNVGKTFRLTSNTRNAGRLSRTARNGRFDSIQQAIDFPPCFFIQRPQIRPSPMGSVNQTSSLEDVFLDRQKTIESGLQLQGDHG